MSLNGDLLRAIFGTGRLARPTKVQRLPCNGTAGSEQRWFSSVDEVEGFARAHDAERGTLAYCPALFDGSDGDDHVTELRAIVLDFDGKDGLPKEQAGRIYTDEAFRRQRMTDAVVRFNRAEKKLGKATALEVTGYGVHAVWVLEEPLVLNDLLRQKAKETLSFLAVEFGADKASATLSHYFRIPDTTNWKGPTPRRCTVVAFRPAVRLKFGVVAMLHSAANFGSSRRRRGRGAGGTGGDRRPPKPLGRGIELEAGIWRVDPTTTDKFVVSIERGGKEVHRDVLPLDSAKRRADFARRFDGDKALHAAVERDLLELAGMVAKRPKASRDFADARRRYDDAHPIDWSAHGRTCPVCRHNGCFGKLDSDPLRWSCFSADHGATGVGVRGEKVWHGGALDLDAHAQGIRPHELLVRDGYLEAAQRASAGRKSEYVERDGGIFISEAGDDTEILKRLTNFTARIAAEVTRDDGVETQAWVEIEAELRGRKERVVIPSSRFEAMRWPTECLGPGAILEPGMGVKDQARAAIQKLSGDIPRRRTYTHTGWSFIDGRWVYLHGGGAIGTIGTILEIEIYLPIALSRYRLPPPPEGEALRRAVQASLDILAVAPLRVTTPVLAAVYRAPLGAVDHSLHLCGPSGAGKSELAALAAQHYGPGLDARNLSSWGSTGNALEGQSFVLKDALFVVDDFAPGGAAHDVARQHREADRFIRAQGNLAGRARLAQDGSLRPTHAPRGMTLSTGEDLIRGHSARARVVSLELGKDDIDWSRLGRLQEAGARGLLAEALAGYIRWLAPRHERAARRCRTLMRLLRTGATSAATHRRTPTAVAELGVGLLFLTRFARQAGVLSGIEARDLRRRLWAALLDAGSEHGAHVQSAEPTQRFLELVASTIGAGGAHLADLDGRVPPGAAAWGWRVRTAGREEWVPSGRCIGWMEGESVYLDIEAALSAIHGLVGGAGEGIAIGAKTLGKRLKERGLLVTTDEARGRNTVRVIVAGVRRVVHHIHAHSLYPPASSQESSQSDHDAGKRPAEPVFAGESAGAIPGDDPESSHGGPAEAAAEGQPGGNGATPPDPAEPLSEACDRQCPDCRAWISERMQRQFGGVCRNCRLNRDLGDAGRGR